MAIGLLINQPTQISGLQTNICTVTIAGPYTCSFNLTLPYRDTSSGDSSVDGGSALTCLIKQNSSTLGTYTVLNANQKSLNGSANMLCAAGDTISVVLSSSAAADNAPNGVKGVVNVYQGG